MSEEIHKVQFVLPPNPPVKEQLKDATVATVIGLTPLALMIGAAVGYAKFQEWREARKSQEETPVIEEPDAE